ncbi:MAG: hypothetical protein ACJAY2_002581 [Pseudomonadales bacterium]|jgi:hypothetical protein
MENDERVYVQLACHYHVTRMENLMLVLIGNGVLMLTRNAAKRSTGIAKSTTGGTAVTSPQG